MQQGKNHLLTIAETDAIINHASNPQMGAIEDATETETVVTCFFESGVACSVYCRTGAVTISTDPGDR